MITRIVCRSKRKLALLLLAAALLCSFSFGVLFLAKDEVDGELRPHVHVHGNIDDAVMTNRAQTTAVVDAEPSSTRESLAKATTNVNPSIHTFYYAWYGNPTTDGEYYHWNHQFLPHWSKEEATKWPKGVHTPPDDIGSTFYPSLGCYSSASASTLDTHMRWLAEAGVGTVVHSWYPSTGADEQNLQRDTASLSDALSVKLLDAADKHGLKVAFHIEPYNARTALSVGDDIRYIVRTYGEHPAFYRHQPLPTRVGDVRRPTRPLIYVYDSYLIPEGDWMHVLRPDGGDDTTIRGSDADAYVIGLLLAEADKQKVRAAGFDGFYTYFAAEGFTGGSRPSAWASLEIYARKHGMIFIPSVGPGYDDTRIRPWNAKNTKSRDNGGYYERMFASAIASRAPIISITSFNEWHEGSQIEPAMAKVGYPSYADDDAMMYMKLTKRFVRQFEER